ncbi:MAG TPA: hypothetical protein VFQ53_01815 [Kofleriaceae bacterium]|nr:hypothetical protein [Kofleriaceae bacterium]
MKRPPIDAPASDWLVYGDSLQTTGDPRGELVSLSHAVAEGKASADVRDALVERHAEAVLGPAIAAKRAAYRFGWKYCLLDSVEIRVTRDDDAGELVGAVLKSPAAEELRELVIVGVGNGVNLAKAVYELEVERVPPRLSSIALVDETAAKASMLVSRDFDPGANLVALGPLQGLWKLPLQHLRLEVADAHQVELGTIDAPELRSFTLRDLRFGEGPDVIGALERANMPKLEELELRLVEEFGANIVAEDNPYVPVYSDDEDFEDRYDEAEDGENYNPIDWTQLEGLLRKLRDLPLRRLALTSFDNWESLLETIGRVGLPRTLKELDLSDSSFDEAAAAWVTKHPELVRHLERLVIERVSLDDPARLALLAKVGPQIVHSSDGAPTYRYVVGSE